MWLCPDNSGIAIYNGYDGNTLFLRNSSENSQVLPQNAAHQDSTRLQGEISSSKIGSLLGLNKLECEKMITQLINWRVLIGSDD